MIWVAGRSPTLVSQNLKVTTLTYLAIEVSLIGLSRSKQFPQPSKAPTGQAISLQSFEWLWDTVEPRLP